MPGWVTTAYEDYTRRLRSGMRVDLEELTVRNKAEEEKRLLDRVGDDYVVALDEHPLTFARAFDAHGAEVVLLGELGHPIGDGLDVAVGVAGGDDDDVSDIGEVSYVHDFDVDGFHVIERGIDDAQQGLRDG